MNLFALTVISLVGLLTVSCSEKSASDRDKKLDETNKGSPSELADTNRERTEESDEDSDEKPEAADVGEDCVAFLRATTVAAAQGGTGACPTCPASAGTAEVLKFNNVTIDRISPSGASCEVTVKIYATFNPSHGGAIVGGLTKWISPEQKAQYARGETPSGEQVYPVKVTYRRTATDWRPVEFD